MAAVWEWLSSHWGGMGNWFINVFLGGGFGWSVWRAVKERRQRRAKKHVDESQATVEEATISDKVVSSSITTLDASRVSMLAAWESERTSLKDHIAFDAEAKNLLRARVAELEAREVEKDRLIQELRDQVSDLQDRIRHQAAELTDIADRLCELQTKPQAGE